MPSDYFDLNESLRDHDSLRKDHSQLEYRISKRTDSYLVFGLIFLAVTILSIFIYS